MTHVPADDQRRRSLRRFIVFEQVTCSAAVAVILVVHVWLHPSPYLLALAVIVGLAGAVMGLARRALSAGEVGRSVAYVAVAIWGLAVTAPAIATFCLPVTAVAAMLPGALAVPYVGPRALRTINVVSMCVSMAGVLVGTVQDFSGLTPALPAWIPPTVLAIFVPFTTGLHVMVSSHNSSRLSEALGDALDANRRLQASERELRTSRGRLLAVTDEERRRLSRDLHDGAQQRLLAMALDVERCRRAGAADPVAAACLDRLAVELCRSMEELRDFAHGVYPTVLRDFGLEQALAELASRAPFPCSLEVSWPGRCAPDVEASVYWCCAEALQNVAKHAGPGARARIRVRPGRRGTVDFLIEDDGHGFDPRPGARGRGLTNLADRIAAVGGEVVVSSGVGQGVRVHGWAPARDRPDPPPTPALDLRREASALSRPGPG